MPELPEVEIVRRGLRPYMEGAAFTSVALKRKDLRFAFQPDFVPRLEKQTILNLSRRAKYIIAEMAGGDALVLHLGMTGRFSIFEGPKIPAAPKTPGKFYYSRPAQSAHDHVVFTMSNGARITYNDVRRFGFMAVVRSAGLADHPLFAGLGVEPLSEAFNADALLAAAQNKRQPLKALLLNQRVLAGLGNIYASESLFAARLSPELPAGRLTAETAVRLCAAVKTVLLAAIAAGGSSFRDYRHADGGSGSFQEQFAVYGRNGSPCPNRCGANIARITQHGRATFYCPRCQRVP